MKRPIFLLMLASLLALFSACANESDGGNDADTTSNGTGVTPPPPPPAPKFTPYVIADSAKIQNYEEGLKIYVVQEGQGDLPQNGQTILIHYHGMLQDGSVFDSSFERGSPFSFALGTGQVIRGWDLGIAKLRFGSKAILILPPEIAYGSMARPNIPANSTLVFHVELLGAY